MDLLNALNEAASMDQPIIDKSQVYRWVAGQLPQQPTLKRIADALGLRDPETNELEPNLIFRHPAEVWIIGKIRGQDEEDVKRLRQIIEIALPRRSAG